MISSLHCPDCGLKLREISHAGGGVEAGVWVCRRGHRWEYMIEGRISLAGLLDAKLTIWRDR